MQGIDNNGMDDYEDAVLIAATRMQKRGLLYMKKPTNRMENCMD